MCSSLIEKRTILVVEDEEDILNIIQEVLTPECTELLTARNGIEALEVLGAHPEICAILSDVSMPKMNGLQLLEKVRAGFNAIPFVILTGYGDSNSYRSAVQLNATDFLEKPFNPELLVGVVKKAMEYGLELQQAQRDLDTLLASSSLSPERLESFKRAKMTVLGMRIEKAIYVEKDKKAS